MTANNVPLFRIEYEARNREEAIFEMVTCAFFFFFPRAPQEQIIMIIALHSSESSSGWESLAAP